MTCARRPPRPNGLHAALLLTALFALFWRAVVPGGFMPTWQEDGLAVTVCTGQGLVTGVLGTDGTPRDADTPSGTANTLAAPCAFASLGLPLLPAAPTALPTLAPTFLALTARGGPETAPRHASLRLRPPLRAPPLHAAA